MRLVYEIAGDDRQLRRTLRGVEGEVRASSRRTARETSGRQNDAHVRAREIELRRIEREERRAAERTERYWTQAHRRAGDARIREEQRTSRAIEREQRRAERIAARMRSGVARGALGATGGAIRSVAAVGGTAGAIIGGVAIASALDSQLSESARASKLANQAGTPEIKGELLNQAQHVRGFTGMEALEGLGSFVDVTGDLASARAILADMGDVAIATSTDLGELGAAMGTAFIPLADQIKSPTERLKALRNVMKATAGMGAVGAVEVKDLATEMAGLAATSSRFQGDSERNLNMMVAFAQAARQRGGASSAAEAVTSVQRFGSDMFTGPAQKNLNALDINVFADKNRTQLRGADDILIDVLQKTKGDLVQLHNIFGERGVRAVQGFSPLFTQAEAANAKLPAAQRLKSGAAGTAAVRGELDRLLKASVSDSAIQERVASRMSDPDMLIKENMKRFNAAVGSELIPVITKAIPKFTDMIPTLAKATAGVASFADFMMDNPLAGIGGIIGAKIAADIGGSAIKDAIQSSLATAIGASGGLKVGGAIAIAAGSVILAADQFSDLTKQTGGAGGILAGFGAMLNGESFFKGVDDFLNEQAIGRSADPFSPENMAKRDSALMASSGTPAQPAASSATAASMARELVGSPALDRSASELSLVAKELRAAASALNGGASAPNAPARNGPINTRGT